MIIRLVRELAEENPQVMAFLEEKRIMPGVQISAEETLPLHQTIALRVEKQSVTLGFAVGRYIFVELLKESNRISGRKIPHRLRW